MQWLDVLILVILCVSLIWGLKTGLLEVAFLCLGIVAGWWLAGRYADSAGDMVSFSASADAFISALAYTFIVSVCCAIFVMVGRVIKAAANAGSIGAVSVADRLSGIALGLVVGLTVSGALIVIFARLAFAFTVADADLSAISPGDITADSVGAIVSDRRELLVDGLVGSTAVSIFLNVWDAAPKISFGPAVGDFALALDLLSEEAKDRKAALSVFIVRDDLRRSEYPYMLRIPLYRLYGDGAAI